MTKRNFKVIKQYTIANAALHAACLLIILWAAEIFMLHAGPWIHVLAILAVVAAALHLFSHLHIGITLDVEEEDDQEHDLPG